MFAATRLLNLLRGSTTNPEELVPYIPETTKTVADLSDEIAAINKRIRQRANAESPEDAADRERLRLLMEELNRNRSSC
ncbi:MAG TPA: hypothetical protein VFZ49_10065 [Pyrinomonadaceae bacterium]